MDAYAIVHDEPDLEVRWPGGEGTGFPLFAPRPAIVDQADLDWEGGEDASLAAGEGIRWKVLIAGERTETRGLATGIAEVAPGAELMCHRHEPAEIYFIVSGRGEVDIGDRSQPVGARLCGLHPA